jgi:hypothetical protein
LREDAKRRGATPAAIVDILQPHSGFYTKNMPKKHMFFINNSVSAVHPELNGFDGAYFGGHPHGIHLAVGPDRMHLLYEGIGMAIIGWTTIVITKAGISCG